MLKRIATAWWGNFDSSDEVKKFLKLAVIFGLIIGIYWTLRPIKDSVFGSVVGGKWLWLAKIFSVIVIAPLVIMYSKLIDKFPREKVFYGLLLTYAVLTLSFSLALMHPVIGLANPLTSPFRIVGWTFYVFVESFGSLIVALFWVITTDITLPDSARRGFPIIAMCGQIGNILGPRYLNTSRLNVSSSAPIVGIAAGLMLVAVAMMMYFIKTTPKALLAGYHDDKKDVHVKEPGFLEGLKLLFSEKYLLGIFFIVSVYEIIVTIVDNYFKLAVYAAFDTEALRSAYLSSYAENVGWVATLCVLFGINKIQHYMGITVSLLVLPVLVGAAMLSITVYPGWMDLALWVMVFSKAVNYAFNQPVLKQLYIPTTKEARYKTQGWIEMFGSRSAKGIGSIYNSLRLVLELHPFLISACILSMGCIGIWMPVALYISRRYTRAIERNEIVC